MTSLIGISGLSMGEIRDAVVEAFRNGIDRDSLEDFLSSVDWSGYDRADSLVRETLGRLEQWATLYREGDLSVQEYAANLLSVLHKTGSLSA